MRGEILKQSSHMSKNHRIIVFQKSKLCSLYLREDNPAFLHHIFQLRIHTLSCWPTITMRFNTDFTFLVGLLTSFGFALAAGSFDAMLVLLDY